MKNRPSVAVIGAGLSGLRCADVLLRNGINVSVFEARNRIGGRVYQVSSGDHLVDVGANWIHEPNDNPIMKIAQQIHTVLFERPDGYSVFGSDGERRPNEVALKLGEIAQEVTEQAAEYSYLHSAEIDPSTSIMDFIREKVTKAYEDQPAFLQDLLHEAERLGLWDGSPVSSLSLKHLFLEEGPGGTDCFVAGTYKDIVAHISKPLLGTGVIQLEHEVKRIDYSRKSEDAKITIETTNGIREDFDDVVVTCPLGWLQQHKTTMFVPELPLRLSQAIDNIKYGNPVDHKSLPLTSSTATVIWKSFILPSQQLSGFFQLQLTSLHPQMPIPVPLITITRNMLRGLLSIPPTKWFSPLHT